VRAYLVSNVLADDALAGFVFGLESELRRNADDGRRDPDGSDHGRHARGCALHGVLERTRDDAVAVHANGTQVQYGSGAQEDIQ